MPSAPNPVQAAGCDRRSRAVKRSAPYTRQKRTTGGGGGARNPPYSDPETEILLDVVEAQRPIGQIGWTAATEAYNRECQLRSIDIFRDQASINRKFYSVRYPPITDCYDI